MLFTFAKTRHFHKKKSHSGNAEKNRREKQQNLLKIAEFSEKAKNAWILVIMASAEASTSSPKKTGTKEKVGPTLSTSTSSFEPLDPHDPQLNHLASLMFNKTADWITCELETTSDEYKLIQQMNK